MEAFRGAAAEPPASVLPRGQHHLRGRLEASVPGSELQALLGCGAVLGLQVLRGAGIWLPLILDGGLVGFGAT